MNLPEIKQDSLFLAPMEGVTDGEYREVIQKNFGGWDYYACDFLRVPTNQTISEKRIIEHFGESNYRDEGQRNKTMFQILTTFRSETFDCVEKIERLGFPWLDLNLGCPAKKVNGHGGGASLIAHQEKLSKLLKSMRELFSGRFSVKIRVGLKDDSQYGDLLSMLSEVGLDMLTVHGRTRDQLYKGVANWDYIKMAVDKMSCPVIGNGDVWSVEDIISMRRETGCHGVMIARGALKMPWIAYFYKSYRNAIYSGEIEKDFANHLWQVNTPKYYYKLNEIYSVKYQQSEKVLRRFKGLSRYLFDSNPDLKSRLLRSENLEVFLQQIESLPNI